MEAALVNSIISRPAPACARHARKKFYYCLILWVVGLAAGYAPISLQQAQAASGVFTGTDNTGTLPLFLDGVVFYDANQNGKLDNSEWAIAGAGIELFNVDNPNTPQATTTSNSTGQYSFDDLAPGTYSLAITTDGNWLPIQGYINDLQGDPVYTGLGTPNAAENQLQDLTLNAGDTAEMYGFAAQQYPIQLLSKRMLLASSAPLLVHAVPEPGAAIMLIALATVIGGLIVGRFFK